MEKKYAIAPWSYTGNSWQYTTVYDAKGTPICRLDLEDWGVTEENQGDLETEQEKAALMIAAAPELLASCVAMMKYMEDGFLVRNTSNDADSDWALKALSFVKDMQTMHAAIAKAEGRV